MKDFEKLLNNFPFKLILGSASPRRQELLKSLGFDFQLQPINVEEEWPKELERENIVLFLSALKSKAFGRTLKSDEILITADTIVWCEGKVFNKPADFDQGKKILSKLSGKMHEVFTGVCLRSNKQQITFFDVSKVYFKELNEGEIEYYLKKYKPYDKAGGYGVQDWIGYIAIEKIEGSFYNVMGLPVKLLFEKLLDFASHGDS